MLFYIGRREQCGCAFKQPDAQTPRRPCACYFFTPSSCHARERKVRAELSQSDERGRRHGGRRRCSRCRRSSRLPRLVQQQYVTHFVRPATGFLPAATPPPSVHRQRQSSPGRGKRALPSNNHRPLCFFLLFLGSYQP